MTTSDHYREAEGALRTAEQGSPASPAYLATAQLHAMLAVADQLWEIRNELIHIRTMIAGSPPCGFTRSVQAGG